jgi:L-fuconolactonase
MVQDIADDDWLLSPALAPLLAAMARNGLVFDALLLPRHLPRLLHVVDHHLDLEFELDHCGKPRLATGEIATRQCDIALLAEHPNIVCKLSGLLTEAAPDWQIADLRRRWIMLLRASGRSACCGEATGRWSIWRGLMQNGSLPPKPC